MVNQTVYEKLKEVAKKKYKTPNGKTGIIYYEDLVIECKLHLNLDNIADRNKLSHILGEISEYELKHKRPPISVLVVLKNKSPLMPSYGFFNFMDELGVRKLGESDEQLRNRLMSDCYNYWSKIKIIFQGNNASGKSRTMNHIENSLKKLWKEVKLDHDKHIIECN